LKRHNRDDKGGRAMRAAGERFYRCGRVWNDAAESPTLPRGLRQCFRVWNGGGGPAAVFYGYNTVTEPVMLPERLRHRYRHWNFKEFRACSTHPSGDRRWWFVVGCSVVSADITSYRPKT